MDPYFLTIVDRFPTVIASIIITVLASYVALDMAGRIHDAADRGTAALWVAAGSAALGSGIWATHFVSMSAATYPFDAGYETGMTIASWFAAVLASAVMLVAAGKTRPGSGTVVAVSLIGGSIAAAMHYIAMLALVVAPAVVYHVEWITGALAAAIVGSGLVLVMPYRLRHLEGWRRVRRQLAAAAACGAAFAAMHYLAMASTDFDADTICLSADGIGVDVLGTALGCCTVAVLCLILLMTTIERRVFNRAKHLDGSLSRVREELQYVTFNDTVTGLPNRLVFQDRLQQAVARSQRSGASIALLLISVDGFKSLGHASRASSAGETLKQIADGLLRVSRISDTVASVGGDQFMIIVDDISDLHPAAVAERLSFELKSSVSTDDHLTVSIGITVFPTDGDSASLVSNAAVALEAAQTGGGNCYRFFESAMNAEAHLKTEWLSDLRRAVDKRQLELLYQPKIHASSGKIAGVEALLRWHHPTRGTVSPAVFIPLAEQFGLINEIGKWVIDEAARQMGAWCRAGIRMRVAVNLSVHQLRRPQLVDEITQALASHGVDAGLLTCEITETGAMDNTHATLAVFERLQLAGIQSSIDDFGTGYSSLSYLRRLPVRQLKIDRSFVNDLGTSDDARSIVEAIINLAHALRLEVVAEGVETRVQEAVLVELGCDKLQGFLYAKPMPASAITERAAGPRSVNEQFRESIVAYDFAG